VDKPHCAKHPNMVVAFPAEAWVDAMGSTPTDQGSTIGNFEGRDGLPVDPGDQAAGGLDSTIRPPDSRPGSSRSSAPGAVRRDVEAFHQDELLTSVMIYWVANSITSSTRLYETMKSGAGPSTERVDSRMTRSSKERTARRAGRRVQHQQWASAEQWSLAALKTDASRGGCSQLLSEGPRMVLRWRS
jgi:hypothetical protein